MKGSQLGYILNSDMTVTSSKQSGKTPIGVVVCSYAGGGGQAMALKSIGSYQWGEYGIDVPDLPTYYPETAYENTASCENSAKIREHGDSSIHPAVWAAYNYSTEGTEAGDWCLPAAGIFASYAYNQDAINTGFSRANGTQITVFTRAWSSTENGRSYVFTSWFGNYNSLSTSYKDKSLEVRPVIEF